MAEIGSGDYKVRAAKKAADALKQSEAGLATQGLKLRCDVNGCVIVPIHADQYTPGLTGNRCPLLSAKRSWEVTELQSEQWPQHFIWALLTCHHMHKSAMHKQLHHMTLHV